MPTASRRGCRKRDWCSQAMAGSSTATCRVRRMAEQWLVGQNRVRDGMGLIMFGAACCRVLYRVTSTSY